MRHAAAAAALLLLASCGGGKPPPELPVTIADPLAYLAQSRACDGNPATLLRADDPITCRRVDFGRAQASDSFLTADGGAITTWSYAPWTDWESARLRLNSLGNPDDGGEKMELRGDRAVIVATQDGGKSGVQWFPIPWTVLTTRTVDCAHGWTIYGMLERGCRATVGFPRLGPVDCVISEHGDDNAIERIFLCRGWGRLAWQAHARGAAPADQERCPDFGWNASPRPGQVLADCRIAVNVEPGDGRLTGAQLWHP